MTVSNHFTGHFEISCGTHPTLNGSSRRAVARNTP